MSIDNKFLIKKVTQRESFIACFCRATRMPFLYCDPVTYADQVWIFADENGLKEFAGRFAGKKIALQGTVIRKPQFAGFFGSLLHIGVTEIVSLFCCCCIGDYFFYTSSICQLSPVNTVPSPVTRSILYTISFVIFHETETLFSP